MVYEQPKQTETALEQIERELNEEIPGYKIQLTAIEKSGKDEFTLYFSYVNNLDVKKLQKVFNKVLFPTKVILVTYRRDTTQI